MNAFGVDFSIIADMDFTDFINIGGDYTLFNQHPVGKHQVRRGTVLHVHVWGDFSELNRRLVPTVSISDPDAAADLSRLLGEALDRGLVEDAALASNEAQAEAFWRIRDSISEAERTEVVDVLAHRDDAG